MVDQRLTTNASLFYYITDRAAFPGNEADRRRLLLKKIAEAARAGVDYIQLREKDLSTCELESLAAEAVRVINENEKHANNSLRAENRELRTALLINSRTDVALAVGAAGVHLRSDDISPSEVQKVWTQCGAGALARQFSPGNPVLGVSCHASEDVIRAADYGATFAIFGPVFEKGGSEPAGLARLHEACQADIPVLALGGVTIENAGSCLDAGAAGIAGIRLFQENDTSTVVRKLRGRAVF